TYYKRATILRRISRRMQVNAVEDLAAYLGFLRTNPGEAGALLKDLLISVTNFFRDREAFTALEQVLPELFVGKGSGDSVRVWVPGCATGEEAYSIAMMLVEYARTLDLAPAVQVFACDLDEDAVHVARAGFYPDAITADVSADRLRRFFVKEHNGYRVRRELREIVLFAAHDLLKDAPFSRLDLISCRNLLIYLNREAQARAFEIFHFALQPDGLLFIGSSESMDEGSPLFQILDKKNRLYRRKSVQRPALPVPTAPSTLFVNQIGEQIAAERAKNANSPVMMPGAKVFATANARNPPGLARTVIGEPSPSLGELHFRLIEQLAPPSVLVTRDYEVQHLSESAGRFLQMVGGEPTRNLLRLIHPALRLELRAALLHATQTGEVAEAVGGPMELDGQARSVAIRVTLVGEAARDYLVVTFGARDQSASTPRDAATIRTTDLPEPVIQHLERELEQTKRQLRDTVEQYEASTEELKGSNEELQAMNEELRSATEELETSREELQSINEELTTVNQELKEKVDELGHANSDLQNLMGSTAIATLFLDREMRIMRFTDSAVSIFNLIPGDLGRPLSDLQQRIDYADLAADAAKVLEKLVPVERQVTGPNGSHYLARILPYRTVEDQIAGVVLTFVDITERHRAQEELRETVGELSRFNAVAVGRESRMIDLKKEINALCVEFGQPPRYPLDFEDNTNS
ncbi:MAG TPA: CheR family methyltransferase, partial [Candidatus Synoicihabitans sp.]|nr:CheR family methyltransferase [Candidatus Synoicihabitans sp.]